jgi:transposase
MGATVIALVAVVAELNAQIARLEEGLADRFEKHPAAEVIRSLPGLEPILGARVLGKFGHECGDDPDW